MTLREALRDRLRVCMRAGDRAGVQAVRTALAALDNAGAVPGSDQPVPTSSARVAGAHAGLGAAEAERRELMPAEERELVTRVAADYADAAGLRRAAGDDAVAERAARSAAVLREVLDPGEPS